MSKERVQEYLATINTASSLDSAKAAIETFRLLKLKDQVELLYHNKFLPEECKKDEIKEFYKFYLKGFDYKNLKALIEEKIEIKVDSVSFDVSFYCAFSNPILEDAFREVICELPKADFNDLFFSNLSMYPQPADTSDAPYDLGEDRAFWTYCQPYVSLGKFLLDRSNEEKAHIYNKIKGSEVDLRTPLVCYSDSEIKTLIDILRDEDPSIVGDIDILGERVAGGAGSEE